MDYERQVTQHKRSMPYSTDSNSSLMLRTSHIRQPLVEMVTNNVEEER